VGEPYGSLPGDCPAAAGVRTTEFQAGCAKLAAALRMARAGRIDGYSPGLTRTNRGNEPAADVETVILGSAV
jgi:hypothetical protein